MTNDPAHAGPSAALVALYAALQADPRQHDFFALLRRIERGSPEAPRFGHAARPSQEAVRLGQDPELDFAVAALSSFDVDRPPAPRIGVRFFGLLGPQGPMPLHFTEFVRERFRYRNDPTLVRFLDVFHHRLLLLFYRSWAQHQPVVHRDRPHDDRYAVWLGSAFGRQPMSADAGAAANVGDTARLFQAGLLGARSRHPEGLAKLLRQHFGVPVRIEQHVAQWLVLDADDRSRLGWARNRAVRTGNTHRLGVDATSGAKVLDRQFKFRVVVGPLTAVQYDSFLPATGRWLALKDWVQTYTGLDLQWDVLLVMAHDHVPAPCLGRKVRLGVTGWIGRAPSLPQRCSRSDCNPQAGDRGDLRLAQGALFRTKEPQHA